MSVTNRHACLTLATLLLTLTLAGCGTSHTGDPTMTTGLFSKDLAAIETAMLADDRAGIATAIAAGADVNTRGAQNRTLLMVAVDRLRPSAVAELLARGANPNLKADDGTSAVSLAVENYRNAPEIMELLFRSGGDPNIRRPNEDPVLIRFVNDRNCERIRYMKSVGADLDITTRAGDPIITWSSVGQDWDIVWCFLELGARFDYETSSRSPISRSLKGTFPAPDSPIYPYKVRVWQFLKDHGIAVPPLNQ